MNSMTGFGRASTALGSSTVSVRVTSVNRKALDLKISLPEAWSELEVLIAEEVRRVASRGAVQLRVELTTASGAGETDFDEAAAAAWLERLRKFTANQGLALEPDAQTVAMIAGQFRRRVEPPGVAEVQTIILTTVREALVSLSEMRAVEGSALKRDFDARLALLAVHLEAIVARAPGVVHSARETLLRRLRESGLELHADDDRVLKEVAMFADRCDISEELTRTRSHHSQLKKLLGEGSEVGRKAEFILQEMSREVNTIGSKANDYEIARLVIELKNELERIKEQVANVE